MSHPMRTVLPLLLFAWNAMAFQGAPLPAAGALGLSSIESGKINGASFRIDVPAGWKNGGLVMYCHGYQTAGSPPANHDNPRAKALRDVFLSRGFAFAQSDYRAQGWAVKEALEDTEALRRHFVSKYGKPGETYITGHSMGGFITIAAMERFPDVYKGGLPMCGPLSPALDFFEDRVFDMVVTFEYLFPGTLGPAVSIPADTSEAPAKIRAAIKESPEKAAVFARRFEVGTAEELPGVLAFFQNILKEMERRAGGNAFDNRNTIYTGFGDDPAINRGVKRYPADPKARDYLRQNYTPTGRITRPVLTVHTTYDQLVIARHVNSYDVIAALAGAQDLFVAGYVAERGHCNISAPRTGAAFDALLGWSRGGPRPAAGELR